MKKVILLMCAVMLATATAAWSKDLHRSEGVVTQISDNIITIGGESIYRIKNLNNFRKQVEDSLRQGNKLVVIWEMENPGSNPVTIESVRFSR